MKPLTARALVLGAALLSALLAFASPAAAARVTVGLVFDGPPGAETALVEALMAEVVALNAPAHTIEAPPEKRAYGGFDRASIAAAVERLMTDPEVRLVIAVGPMASHTLARRATFEKPAFAPFILDPRIQALPLADGRSGKANLNYLTVPYDLPRALTEVQRLFGARKVALMTRGGMLELAPGVPTGIVAAGRSMGIELSLVATGDDPAAAVADVPADTQAVLVTPLPGVPDEKFAAFAEALRARKLPSFAFLSDRDVQRGLLAGDVPRRYFERLRRRVALNVQRALDGEDPGTFPVTFDGGASRLWLNLETAQAVGVEIPWTVLIDARVVAPDHAVGRTLALDGVLRDARTANLDVKAQLLARDGGLEDIRKARANLLPSLDATAYGRMIDADRAEASLGNNPQYSAGGSLKLQQVIYAEAAWAGLHVQEALQADKDAALRALELDTVQAAAVAYFNVLRARSLIETTARNLEAARENLELALVRRTVGASTAADVWRWQSEIARLKQELISAFSTAGQARIQLNRLLNRPEDEPFAIDPGEQGDDALLARFDVLMTFLDGQTRFRNFARVLADEAVQNAPELAQLDAAIAATERDLTRVERSYFVPDFALQGEVSTLFAEGGEGTEPPTVPGFDLGLDADDLNWELRIVASLSLFDGGARYAAADKARLDLQRLEVQRQSIAQKLRQAVHSELYDALTSHSGIGLSRERRDAAQKSLELMTQAYGVGAVSIADLIDAQTNAFAAEQGAVNAVYDFMIAMANVERAMGVSRIMQDSDERRALVQRLLTAWRAEGIPVPTPPPAALTPPDMPSPGAE